MKSDEIWEIWWNHTFHDFIRFHQISSDFIRFHQISSGFIRFLIHTKTNKLFKKCYSTLFQEFCFTENIPEELVGTNLCLMEKHEKQKTRNHLTCSYLFPKVWKQVPFPKVPGTPSKQSFGLFIPFPKGLKTSSLSQGSRDTKQTIIWTVHTFSQRSENKYPFPRFQRHQANNHLNCSCPFSRAQKLLIPFPKGSSCCLSCFCP